MSTGAMTGWVGALAAARPVIVFDQQGHGRTPDTPRPLSYEQFDEQMRQIAAPTMVIIGDADGVRPEHAVAMFRLRGGGDEAAAANGEITGLPAARLVILPATSHISISGAQAVLAP